MANETVLPSVTALTVTGNAVTVGWGRESEEASLGLSTSAPQRGVGLILHGYAPSLAGIEATLPSSVALSIDGQAVLANVHHFPSPILSSLGLAGQSLTYTVDHRMTPAIGTLTLTGKVPTAVTPDHHIALPARLSLVLFGYEAIWTDSSDPNDLIVPLTGSGLFAGQLPISTNTSDIFVNPTEPSLALTGQAPALVKADRRLPAAGALVLAEQAVIIPIGEETFPAVATLNLAFSEPVLQQSLLQLTLTGHAPAIPGSFVLTPGAGSLTLSPQLAFNGNAVQSVPLTLTGKVPTLQFTSFFTAGKGNIIDLTTQRDISFIAAPLTTLLD